MKRRNFFKSLALMAGVGSVSPLVFLPKFEPVRWRRMMPQVWSVNPHWVTAPYEMEFQSALNLRELYGAWSFSCKIEQSQIPVMVNIQKLSEFDFIPHPIPLPARYVLKDGKFVPVAPYKLISTTT